MAKDRKAKTTDGRHLLTVGLPLGIVLGVLILGAVLQSGSSTTTESSQARATDPPLPPPAAYEQRQLSDTALEPNLLPEEEAQIAEAEAEPAPARPARRRPSAAVASDDTLERLALRVEADVDRLHSTGADWTAQIGVYCDDQRVSDLLRQFGAEPDFYVLPVLLEDKACFRLCWGSYPSRDRAEQARGLPSLFRGEKSLPRRISTVVQ